ncbi:MAG: hypothetical protein JWM21_4450 [Acidobacteria bacterium]|nr:hypothetical protein [Acidobacteriota bacterium]
MVARLKRRATQLELISRKYWSIRRVIFVGGAFLSLISCRYSGATVGWALAALFLVAFTVTAMYHRRVRESIANNSLMMGIKQIQMARIRLDWDQMPRSAEAAATAGHPFEIDLDVTGERSLHRLLDSAVTREGSERLRSWLLNTTPDALAIKNRQALVKELTGHSLFRDKLQLFSAIAGQDARRKKGQSAGQSDQWESNILVDWIQHTVPRDSLLSTVRALALLAVLNITLLVLNLFELVPAVWPIVFFIYLGVMISKYGRIATAWDELQELEKALRRFRSVFQYLEKRRYANSPGLAEICEPFTDKQQRPSAELKRLGRLASALGLRTNALLWLLVHAFIPWDFYFSHRLVLLKKEVAHLLPRWLDAWHELEALNSLANFAYLNPGYVFPEITTEPIVFEASALGHPLLQPDAKVCNDFESDERHRIAVLTGSNMAGKSTFLRTVGVNLCLSYAGAPANAERMRISLFRVFTCIKVSDSVQDGLSYFYAEVKRLKALLSATEIAGDLPVLFLIDEIFRGTNSRERLIGSRAYIQTLAGRSTVGIVATHDLELVKLADEIQGIANFHFRDDVHEGKMVFDYKLRPGPCPTTNALLIMRMEGLPVDV